MLIEMFARGTGAGRGPVDYCIAAVVPAFDPQTRQRIPGQFVRRDPPPVVLAGDPARTTMLIDSSSNRWRYSSGVIAFADDDDPSAEQQREVMADFEAMAFSGLEREQYDILWIRHEHEGNVELHFVVPRIELRTGKALNIAPPGYAKTFDTWRDSWNYAQGWASPSDPSRARLVQRDDHVLKIEAAALRAGLKTADDPKALIGEYLVQRMEAGQIRGRADVLASLEEAGLTINRQGRDYISVKDGDAKPIRLKGVIYEQQFGFEFDRASAIRLELGIARGQVESQDAGGRESDRGPDPERAAAAREQLAQLVAGRAAFNASRYRPAARIAGQPDIEHGREPVIGAGSNDQQAVGAGERVGSHLDRPGQVGPRPLGAGGEAATDGREGREQDPGRGRGAGGEVAPAGDLDAGSSGSILPLELRRDLGLVELVKPVADSDRAGRFDLAGTEGNDLADVPGQSALPAFWQQLKTIAGGIYDRAREAIGRWISEAVEAVRAGHAALVQSELGLAAAGAGMQSANQQLHLSIASLERANAGVARDAPRACGVLKMQRDDELTRFKTDINLAEYAQAQGYEIDKRESSRASTVLRRGQDKIIVATDTDGHGIYFSVRDDADHGSIIDFVQRREGLNLGQVRKELRPWASGAAAPVQRPAATRPRKPEPSSADRRQVLATWSKMQPQPDGGHPYLVEQRGIDPELLADPRFAGMVRIDARGNAVFPHFDRDGITGYELKNEGFTGFAKHGEKALWHTANLGRAPRIVIVESAIDALSHAQISGDTDAAYVSVGGSMSDKQRELVRSMLEKAGDVRIVLATDNDEAGDALAEQIAALAPASARIERDAPTSKDWNDQLRDEQLRKERSRSYGLSL